MPVQKHLCAAFCSLLLSLCFNLLYPHARVACVVWGCVRVCVYARAHAAVSVRLGERECNSVEHACAYECAYRYIHTGMYQY